MFLSKLSNAQIEQFKRDGMLLVKSVYDPADIAAIQKEIYQVIGLVLKQHGLQDTRRPFAPETFDDGFNDLIQMNRTLGSVVYDAVKQIPAFIRLLAHPMHEDLVRQLRPGAIPAFAAGGYGVRIDNPHEDKFRTFWHQEYPAQLRSLNGLVFWSPLVPVTSEFGPVQVCVGSHMEGPLPVFADSAGKLKEGAYSLRLDHEEKYLHRYPKASPLSDPTDLIILDFLVIHASGYNRAARSRWSMQFRYFDMNEPVGMSHGWKGSYASGVDFKKIHPELFIETAAEKSK
jgi:hypothetical protein